MANRTPKEKGRLVVVDSADGTRVPFLRGILTHSLQEAGLTFARAYAVASKVRADLGDRREVTSADLRKMALARMKGTADDVRRRYASPRPTTTPIHVRYPGGNTVPFSRGTHRIHLECTGLPTDYATIVAAKVHDELVRERKTVVPDKELRRRTHRRLLADRGEEAAHAYLVWEEFRASGRPLVILLGGAPGTGKSTISTMLAHVLEISRTQPTDLLREVMRVMVSERLLPVLHRSSFLTAEALSGPQKPEDPDAALIEGYTAQSALVGVACEAAVRRALDERLSLIIEGVHVHPGLIDRLPKEGDGILVAVMLAVFKSESLRRRLRGRGRAAPSRRPKRFLEHFDALVKMQDWLVREADRAGMPIVVNDDRERALREIAGIVTRTLSERFHGRL